jgi:hypothetical protein
MSLFLNRAGDLRSRIVVPLETTSKDPKLQGLRENAVFEPGRSRARLELPIPYDRKVSGTRKLVVEFRSGAPGEGAWIAGSPNQATVRVTDGDFGARLLRPQGPLPLRKVLRRHRLSVGFACTQRCTLVAVLHGAGRHLATAETRPHFARHGRIRFDLNRAALSDLRAAADKDGVRVVVGASFIGPHNDRKARLPLNLTR